MKAHIGVDDSSPIVHSVHTTAANEHDVTQAHHLLHGAEKRVFADAGYQGVEKRPEHDGRDATWYIAMRPSARRALGDSEDDIETRTIERLKSKLRAHVEHPFRVIKEQFSYRKVRYKGLAKKHEPSVHAVRTIEPVSLSAAISKLICRIAPVVQKQVQ